MAILISRILLVLALLMNSIMVAHASVPAFSQAEETAAATQVEEPPCHEVAADSPSVDEDNPMPCCQTGHCHCLVMQMTGVGSSLALLVPAAPVPVAAMDAYVSPVSSLMLRPPIA